MSFMETVGSLASSVKDGVVDLAGRIDDAIDIDIVIDDETLKEAASDCHFHALETSRLCEETVEKAREMVDFGMEIRSTLGGYSGEDDDCENDEEDGDDEKNEGDEEEGEGEDEEEGEGGEEAGREKAEVDSSVLERIHDLVSGDKVHAAMAIAGELDDLALSCVDQSQKMIASMELGVDALHIDWVEDKMTASEAEGSREGDPDEPDVEDDVRELEECVEAVRNVNLFTVMDSGIRAFRSLSAKGCVCRDMFRTIRKFAEDVAGVSDSVRNFRLGAMVGKTRDLVKDVWRCLRLSGLIKTFAEQVGRLIRWIVDLFREASDRLGMVWGALAYAKDCMADCVGHIQEAMGLCDEAAERSAELVETCGTVRDHLDNIKSVNRGSIQSVRKLMDGEEIRRAINLATGMDDVLRAAVEKVVAMIQRVIEGFDNLPDVIRDGIPDADEAGIRDTDPDPADVEEDVEELHRCLGTIDEADTMNVFQASADGFSGVSDKVGICREMISSSRSFADDCDGTILSFLGTWDLRAAMDKIVEMCRLVRLGEMMRQFAEEIMRLVKANIAVMRAAKEKIKSTDFIPDSIENAVDDVVDTVKDKLDDMAFWKD